MRKKRILRAEKSSKLRTPSRRSLEQRAALQERLEFCVNKLGSPHALAKAAGISPSFNSRTSADNPRDLDPAIAEKIAAAARVNNSWLMFGEGPMDKDEDAKRFTIDKNAFVAVPKLRASTSTEPETIWAYIDRTVMENSVVGGVPMKPGAFRVTVTNGTSKFLHGEWLIVDQAPINSPTSGNYCLEVGGILEAREVVFVDPHTVRMVEPGGVVIKPTLRTYPLSTFLSSFKVVGKVILVTKWEEFVGNRLAPE